jgi:hypothetical protein
MKPNKIKNKWKCSYKRKDGWIRSDKHSIWNKINNKVICDYTGLPF